MIGSIELFGRILFGFTRGVTEHYNPDELLNSLPNHLVTVLWKARDGSGIVILLILSTKNTTTGKAQVRAI